MRMGRRFNSPRQRHQHTESTMTTGFMQNISPKAANTTQCSLIAPQSAEKTTKQRLQKIISSRGQHHRQPSFRADCYFTLAVRWTMAVTEVFGHRVYCEYQKQQPDLETSLQSPATSWALHIPTDKGDPHAHRNHLWPTLNPTSMDHAKIKNQGN